MIRALAYLQATSLANAVMSRLRRLRQPKYAFGALVGVAYFWFFLLRQPMQKMGEKGGGGLPTIMAAGFEGIAALVLMAIVAWTWIVPGQRRAALAFSEPEVAFLFPAPMTRRMLIHYKLLRSQLGILFSAIILALVFRRGAAFGGSAWTHAVGWWLVLSTLNLHFIAASFMRERLLDLGISPWRRRALALGLLAFAGAACWWWLRHRLPLPQAAQMADLTGIFGYINQVLATAPLSWILAPAHWLLGPFFAAEIAGFVLALLPALAMLAAHYFWVIRAEVSFEEASIDSARQRAEQISAMKAGNWRLGKAQLKSRAPPFALAASGFVPIAFLWKNLLALGSFYRLRTWLIACAIAVAGCLWLAADPERALLLKLVMVLSGMFALWVPIIGPMFMQREVRQTLGQLDIYKSCPLPGWQIVLGELLSPLVLMSFVMWFLLLAFALSLGLSGGGKWALAQSTVAIGALGVALVAAPLSGLLLCVPFAGLLYFPAWMENAAGNGGGIEVMGQRLLMFGGFVIVMALALLPAAALAVIAFLFGQWLAPLWLALVLATVVAGTVLIMEMVAAVTWLGEKLERFDLSVEMRG